MRLKTLALLALLLAPAAAVAQEGHDPRRDQLQRQIVQRFMGHVSNELNLDAATRAKLQQALKESGDSRRALAESTTDLRLKMLVASRDSTTSDAEFRRLLAEMTALRQREEDLWKKDQDALARILTPRQHARFVFMWLRFQEQVREMALRPPPGGGGRDGFGPPRPRP